MITIRPAILKQIENELDQTVFSKHMFQVSVNDPNHIIKVNFKGNDSYQFQLKELAEIKQGRFKFVTSESPGQITLELEQFDHENLINARNRIHAWANRIEEDYRISVPEDIELEDIRKEFTEKFTGSSEDTSYFSHKEQSIVSDKLSEFERKFEELYKEKHATNQQMNQMRQQIEKLKRGIEILDKRTWLSAACNRVLDIYKEVKAAKNEVSGLLGDMDDLLLTNSSTEELISEESSE
ncbi:MAG: hypothetical protein methR_P3036 [Methyloprofundus sp.]|nr:MAG: hypothetical protein methR_P3036 [Methyloprofundus sp.]